MPKLIVLCLLSLVAAGAFAQIPADDPADTQATPPLTSEPGGAAAPPEKIEDPYRAYQAKAYDQALQAFIDRQVERPEDPGLALNVGSAHYQMKNYAEAEKAFSTAALSGDEALRAKALYGLGNCAFRQGRLEEAVELYKSTLEVDPDDGDAKYNLEFVRDEIRRRHEEAKKRQEEQEQQQGDQQQEQQGDQGDQGQQGGQDSDQDGLPDETERSAANPTDPSNPDTDQDGIEDGREDRNANGQVDEGETDPNNPDTDGDGIPDSQDPEPAGGEGQEPPQPEEGEEQGQAQPAEGQPQDPEELSQEEAERYLQALEEGRPDQNRGKPARGRSRPAKDW